MLFREMRFKNEKKKFLVQKDAELWERERASERETKSERKRDRKIERERVLGGLGVLGVWEFRKLVSHRERQKMWQKN